MWANRWAASFLSARRPLPSEAADVPTGHVVARGVAAGVHNDLHSYSPSRPPSRGLRLLCPPAVAAHRPWIKAAAVMKRLKACCCGALLLLALSRPAGRSSPPPYPLLLVDGGWVALIRAGMEDAWC